ncbi:MAG: hypothetical protein M1827_006377 [Pycnora praestabilis]|nr:MAG: hypothetical protein M1827_006377 [Pycnora praestabilis]
MWSRKAPITFLLISTAYAACECGYRLRDTGARYTHILANNFTTYPNATSLNTNIAVDSFSSDWTVQSWSAGSDSQDPLPRRNDEANVYIEDGALVMQQIGYSAQDARANQSVSIAAIVSTEQDFLHGSFRTVFKVSDDRGSVGGFFWYHDDNNEIDIEVLTKESNTTTVHYTSHPSISSTGALIPGASVPTALTIPWTSYQEHRFDWSPENITFYQGTYQGSSVVHTTTINVPHVGGSVQMNLWADNSSWSGMPSTTTVTMSVQSILIYYNTTTSDNGTDNTFNTACNAAGGPSSKETVCWDTDPNVLAKAGAGTPGLRAWSELWTLGITLVATITAIVLA